MFDQAIEPLHEQIDQTEGSSKTQTRSRRGKVILEKSKYSNEEEEMIRRPRCDQRDNGQGGDTIKDIKLKILAYQEKSDLEEYLEWEKKNKMIFDCQSTRKNKR